MIFSGHDYLLAAGVNGPRKMIVLLSVEMLK